MERKWHEKTWVIILLIIFFWPVGVFLFLKNSYYSAKFKLGSVVFCLVILGLAMLIDNTDNSDNKIENQTVAISEQSPPDIKTRKEEKKKVEKVQQEQQEKEGGSGNTNSSDNAAQSIGKKEYEFDENNLKELKEYIVATEPFFHEVVINWKEAPSSKRQFSGEEWHNLPIYEKYKIIEGNLAAFEYNIELIKTLNQNLQDIPVPESARELVDMTDKFYNNLCKGYDIYKNMSKEIYSDSSNLTKSIEALKSLVSVASITSPNFNDILDKRDSILKEINSNPPAIEQSIAPENTKRQEKNINSALNAKDLSLGNLTIHDREDKVQSIFGNPVSSSNDNGSKRLKFKDIEVVLRQGKVSALVSLSSAVTTTRGIHEGSSIQEVFDKYGTNYVESSYGDETLYEYVIQSSEGRSCYLRFAGNHSNGKVAYISVRFAQ